MVILGDIVGILHLPLEDRAPEQGHVTSRQRARRITRRESRPRDDIERGDAASATDGAAGIHGDDVGDAGIDGEQAAVDRRRTSPETGSVRDVDRALGDGDGDGGVRSRERELTGAGLDQGRRGGAIDSERGGERDVGHEVQRRAGAVGEVHAIGKVVRVARFETKGRAAGQDDASGGREDAGGKAEDAGIDVDLSVALERLAVGDDPGADAILDDQVDLVGIERTANREAGTEAVGGVAGAVEREGTGGRIVRERDLGRGRNRDGTRTRSIERGVGGDREAAGGGLASADVTQRRTRREDEVGRSEAGEAERAGREAVAEGGDGELAGRDGRHAGVGAGAREGERVRAGLREARAIVDLADVLKRAGSQGEGREVAGCGAVAAEVIARQVERTAVEGEHRGAGAGRGTTDDVASDGERTARQIERTRGRTQRRRGVAELDRRAGVTRDGDRSAGDIERARGRGRGAGVDADAHRAGGRIEDRDARTAEGHGRGRVGRRRGLMTEQQVVGIERAGIEGEGRRGQADRVADTLGELHHVEAQIGRMAGDVEVRGDG